jgi:D-glycero-alpha-D-manno-heptose-7-phosphate kinase
MIHIKTPYRVSLVGGGTDYKEWYDYNDGGVISFSIDKYIHLFLRELPKTYKYKYKIRYVQNEELNNKQKIKHKVIREFLNYEKVNSRLDITYIGEFPARSGLGSSSAFTVGLINGIYSLCKKKNLNKKDLSTKAIYFEQDILKEKVGSQDQVIAAYGGLNKIMFKKDNFVCKKINLDKLIEKKIEDSFFLVWTGLSRDAEKIEIKKFSNFSNKKIILTNSFELVKETEKCLKNKNNIITNLGKILNEQWRLKKSIDPIVSSDQIDKIYRNAINAGASGGKILGAGGGGFFLFLVEEDKRKNFLNKMKKYYIQNVKISYNGSEVIKI